MKYSFSFSWGGNAYGYSKGEYYVNGKPTGKATFSEARNSLARGPRSEESKKIFEKKQKTA